MTSGTVLLVSLTPDESAEIREVLLQFDPEVRIKAASSMEEAESSLSDGPVLLVILRVHEGRRRPDQDIHRTRRLLSPPIPLLLLIPPELARKVKEYLRAGADEYWILPLDTTAFPPRLNVLFEWGQSVVSGEAEQFPKDTPIVPVGSSFLRRLKNGFRRLRTFSGPEPSAVAPGLTSSIAGRWEKLSRLGFGSFGEVWLVQGKAQGGMAVVKIPHSHKLNTKFIREAAILKRFIGHPNAVQLIEVVKEGGKVVIIQEYVEGSTLQELLDQGMDSIVKEKAFLDLLAIVAYAHEHNIMHRDIKPENIIITRSGVLKLLDFGTGKDLTRRSISSTVIGSRPFMAPEQIMGKSRLSSDVWAMGVVLYALATGCLPFYDDNEKQLMDIILESQPELPRNLEPGLPEELERIILRCLQKDWNERYRSAVELRSDVLSHFPDFGTGAVIP